MPEEDVKATEEVVVEPTENATLETIVLEEEAAPVEDVEETDDEENEEDEEAEEE